MEEKGSIRTDEIRRFASALHAMSRAYASLAEWLEQANIKEIKGVGTPTAKKGMGYLGGFTGAILKSLGKSLVNGESIPSGAFGEMFSAEVAARQAAEKRPASPTAAEKQRANEVFEEIKKIARPRKKKTP